LPFSGTEQRSPTALALPPTPEVVRHSGKEGRAGPARSAFLSSTSLPVSRDTMPCINFFYI
jgi:hypothetical protein